MGRLSAEETWTLLREPIVSFVTTLRSDGTPHMTPVWHMVDGDEVVIAVGRQTVKARNVRRDPTAALCVAADQSPQPWLLLNGAARLSEDGVEEFVRAVSAHYMGSEEASPYADDILGKLDFVLIRITPQRVVGFDGLE